MVDLTPTPPGASISDVVAALNNANRNSSLIVLALQSLADFSRVSGTFTLAAAATTTVPQTKVAANSNITLTATNSTAATLMGSVKSLYVSAISPGVSFTVATASGASAAG